MNKRRRGGGGQKGRDGSKVGVEGTKGGNNMCQEAFNTLTWHLMLRTK